MRHGIALAHTAVSVRLRRPQRLRRTSPKRDGGGDMKAFLGSVLTIIAAGVLLIAYGLLGPHAGAFSTYPATQGTPVVYDAQSGVARPMLASEQLTVGSDGRLYAAPQYAATPAAPQYVTYTPAARPVTVAQTAPAPRRT